VDGGTDPIYIFRTLFVPDAICAGAIRIMPVDGDCSLRIATLGSQGTGLGQPGNAVARPEGKGHAFLRHRTSRRST
jgi:hypothetical protein